MEPKPRSLYLSLCINSPCYNCPKHYPFRLFASPLFYEILARYTISVSLLPDGKNYLLETLDLSSPRMSNRNTGRYEAAGITDSGFAVQFENGENGNSDSDQLGIRISAPKDLSALTKCCWRWTKEYVSASTSTSINLDCFSMTCRTTCIFVGHSICQWIRLGYVDWHPARET